MDKKGDLPWYNSAINGLVAGLAGILEGIGYLNTFRWNIYSTHGRHQNSNYDAKIDRCPKHCINDKIDV